jgi:hypothetical protein
MFLTFKNKINDETLEETRGRSTLTPVRAGPGAAATRQIRARVSDVHTGVPPGVRGQTEVRA